MEDEEIASIIESIMENIIERIQKKRGRFDTDKEYKEYKESVRQFLSHHIKEVIRLERKEQKERGIRDQGIIVRETSFERRLQAIKDAMDAKNVKEAENQVEYLRGDFWERQFCRLVTDWGFRTFRTQKYRILREAGLAWGKDGIDWKSHIGLPDILVAGHDAIFWCDIKNSTPRYRYPDYGVKHRVANDWLRLITLRPSLPIYYVVRFYLPIPEKEKSDLQAWREYCERDGRYEKAKYTHERWDVGEDEDIFSLHWKENWWAIRMRPETEVRPETRQELNDPRITLKAYADMKPESLGGKEYFLLLTQFYPLKKVLELLELFGG